MTDWQINITKTDTWTNQYQVYAKAGSPPVEDGDGTYIMTVDMEPWETSVSETWTPPDLRTYYFRVVPVYQREASPGEAT